MSWQRRQGDAEFLREVLDNPAGKIGRQAHLVFVLSLPVIVIVVVALLLYVYGVF